MKIVSSPYNLSIPNVDIPTFVFSSGSPISRKIPQYFDANEPSRYYSLEDAEKYVKRVALGLQLLGLKPDDKLLLIAGNDLYFPVLLWGTIAAGCVFTACSPGASVKELSYQLQDSGAKLILAGPDCVEKALASAAELGIPQSQIYVFGDIAESSSIRARKDIKHWTSFWASDNSVHDWFWRKITEPIELKETTAILNYSSGTTGLPKGVEISHYNAVANSSQLVFKRGLVADSDEGRARKTRITLSGERWLAPLPMYHAYGQMYYCMNAPACGAKVYIMPKFNVQLFLLYLDVYRITFMTGVPTVLTLLAKQPDSHIYNLLSLESVLTGSAPLSPALGEQIAEKFLRSGISVKQGWGMKETTCSCSGFSVDEENDPKSIGWLNPNCFAKVVPIPGHDYTGSIPNGTSAGEIWISGPNIMKGYFRKPQATSEAIVHEDGKRWLRTGDVGYINDRGLIYIIDRIKELIKVKGLQVAPAEVEAVILGHPSVSDVAVVGVKKNGEEYVRAFVVRKTDELREEDITKLVQSKCAPHKWISGGVFFIHEIPKTASGKVMRRLLSSPATKEKTTLSKLYNESRPTHSYRWWVACPEKSPEDVVKHYRKHDLGVKIGSAFLVFSGAFYASFTAAMSTQMHRIPGVSHTVIATQLASGSWACLTYSVPGMFYAATAFRLERDPEITQALNDLSWILAIMPFPPFIIQNWAFAYAIFSDNRPQRLIPHFVGWVNIVAPWLFAFGIGLHCTKSGPFAWNGALSFWLAGVTFAIQFFVNVFFVLRAIEMELPEDTQGLHSPSEV